MARDIPSAVTAAYQISTDAVYERVSGGLINSTWFVQDAEQRFIVQKINRLFDLSVNATVARVCEFLSGSRASTTTLLKTIGNNEYVLDGNDYWRCLSFVPGKTYLRMPSENHAEIAGRGLANFHAAMKQYPEPQLLPQVMVHDLLRHRNHLVSCLKDYGQHRHHATISRVADDILSDITRIIPFPNFPLVALHGDPKLSNFIFDDSSQTACLIDLDTVGRGQILSELGDAFRSWCNPAGEDCDESRFDLDIFLHAIKGYLSVTDSPFSAEQGPYISVATEMISLELAARFCADALTESYFAWDAQNFASASDHQLLRARGQLSLARSVHDQQSEISKIVEMVKR